MDCRARGLAVHPRPNMVAPPRRRTHLPLRVPISARTSSVESANSRAMVKASSASSIPSGTPTEASSKALSASARATLDVGTVGRHARQRGIKPSQTLRDTPSRQPQQLQRGRQLQSALDVAGFDAPTERGAKIGDLDFCLLDPLLISGVRRRVEFCRFRREVVAVTCAHLTGFTGLAELLQRVLAHRLKKPVPRSAATAFSYYQRFVDEQG